MELGASLREIRKRNQMTLAEVAERSGLSTGFVSQVEQGISNPSLKSLKRIGDALGVSMGNLFNYQSENDTSKGSQAVVGRSIAYEQDVRVVRRDQRKMLQWPGQQAQSYLLTPDLRRRLEVTLNIVEVGCEIFEEPYTHDGEEFGWVLEGQYEVTVDGKTFTLREGDTISFPSHLPHSSKAIGDTPAKTLWVITPPSF